MKITLFVKDRPFLSPSATCWHSFLSRNIQNNINALFYHWWFWLTFWIHWFRIIKMTKMPPTTTGGRPYHLIIKWLIFFTRRNRRRRDVHRNHEILHFFTSEWWKFFFWKKESSNLCWWLNILLSVRIFKLEHL